MGKSVILLTIDSLRADRLSALGYPETPNIDQLAENGSTFRAISAGPNTPYSFKSLFTSTYPLMYLPPDPSKKECFSMSAKVPTVAEVARQNGFTTAAFHTNALLSYWGGYEKGFDVYQDFLIPEEPKNDVKEGKLKDLISTLLTHSLTKKIYESLCQRRTIGPFLNTAKKMMMSVPRREAEEINREALTWINRQHGDFFLWVHYMDVHRPFMPPSEYLSETSETINDFRMRWLWAKTDNPEKMNDEEIREINKLYNAEIKYVDSEIGNFLQSLKDMEIYDDVDIILTADHGEELGEHGVFGHQQLYDETILVPLIIKKSTKSRGKIGSNSKELISSLDVAPTIIDFLNVENEPESFQGQSLLSLQKKRGWRKEVFSEATRPADARIPRLRGKRVIALRTEKWKLIIDEAKNMPELYDIEKDPGEIKNLYTEEMEKVEELEEKMNRFISTQEQTRKKVDHSRKKISNLKLSRKI